MLTIDHEKICYLIIKAREFDVKMEPEVPDPGDNPGDDAERVILFDYPDDPTAEEVRACLDGLNDDEACEVLALVWLGQGDYKSDEWDTALADAQDAPDERRPEALMSNPLLADYLEEGLSQLGYSCEDMEIGRL
jgi:hypothetical protein